MCPRKVGSILYSPTLLRYSIGVGILVFTVRTVLYTSVLPMHMLTGRVIEAVMQCIPGRSCFHLTSSHGVWYMVCSPAHENQEVAMRWTRYLIQHESKERLNPQALLTSALRCVDPALPLSALILALRLAELRADIVSPPKKSDSLSLHCRRYRYCKRQIRPPSWPCSCSRGG